MLETSGRVYENTEQAHYLVPSPEKALVTGDGLFPKGPGFTIFFNNVLEIQSQFIFHLLHSMLPI